MSRVISSTTQLNWEVIESRDLPGEWRAEAIGPEGECYLVRFFGPDAEVRARDYAQWVSSDKSLR